MTRGEVAALNVVRCERPAAPGVLLGFAVVSLVSVVVGYSLHYTPEAARWLFGAARWVCDVALAVGLGG